MSRMINQILALFFGIVLMWSTMLNIAFTLAPQTMTHFLMNLMAS